MEKQLETYVASLTPEEKKTMEVVREYLGSSFNLCQTVGFQSWIKKRKSKVIIYAKKRIIRRYKKEVPSGAVEKESGRSSDTDGQLQ